VRPLAVSRSARATLPAPWSSVLPFPRPPVSTALLPACCWSSWLPVCSWSIWH